MTRKEAINGLQEYCGQCGDREDETYCKEKCEIYTAINSLRTWDEVLKLLNNEAESYATFDVGVAMGLEKAIRIIEIKLKEVEE